MKKGPLFTLFLVVFIDLLVFGIVIPILPYYATEFGASATQLGWLMASYSLLQFLFAPFWGNLSDKIGRRPVLLWSIFGNALSMILLGLAPSLLWVFVGRVFAGICGANISTAMAYISDVTTNENRAKGMGMIGAAFGLGFVFGPAIGGVLSRWGYSTPMFFAAFLSLLNFGFALFYLKEALPSQKQRAERRSAETARRFDIKTWKKVLSDERTRMAVFVFFVSTFGFTQLEVIFALFMKSRFGFDAQFTGWLLGLVGVVMIIIQGGLIGKMSKRFGEVRLILFGTIAMSIGLFAMAQSTILFFLVLAMVIVAIGNAVNNPSLSSLASKGAAPNRRGVTMGIYQSAGSLARILGPPVAGWAFDVLGTSAPFLIASGVMAIAFLTGFYFSPRILLAQEEVPT